MTVIKGLLIISHKQINAACVNKYIIDGTVLNLIWKWLKAGYMEEENILNKWWHTTGRNNLSMHENIYLDGADWELAKASLLCRI